MNKLQIFLSSLQKELAGEGRYRLKNAGVAGKEEIIHLAPPADRVPCLMKQLFQWLETTDLHPLVASTVFHYEFEFIHPFADGNGRTGRLWQTLILSRWNTLFGDIAVESMIHEHQQEYYTAINESNAAVNSGPFIEFMLQVILETLQTDQVGDQVSDQVKRLLEAVGDHRMSAVELMDKLGLSHRPTFRKNYLKPGLEHGLLEMTMPDSPRSPTQKYFLTKKGKRMLEQNDAKSS